MFRSTIIIALCAVSVFSQTYFPGDCPETKVVDNFNLEAYLGTWFEVRTYSVPWRANGRCTQADYGLYENGTVSILNTVELYGARAQLLTSAIVIEPGVLAISGPSNPYDLPNYFVLGTDYESFAIGHSCRDNGTHAGHFAWVLTRKRDITEGIYQITNDILTANGVPLEPLLDVDQANCHE